jgi:hypothetical protein
MSFFLGAASFYYPPTYTPTEKSNNTREYGVRVMSQEEIEEQTMVAMFVNGEWVETHQRDFGSSVSGDWDSGMVEEGWNRISLPRTQHEGHDVSLYDVTGDKREGVRAVLSVENLGDFYFTNLGDAMEHYVRWLPAISSDTARIVEVLERIDERLEGN